MIRFIRTKGFELEKSYPGFFLLQAAAGGFLAGLVILLYVQFLTNWDNFQGAPTQQGNLIFGGLYFIVLFIFCCVALATPIRFVSWLLNWPMGVLARLLFFPGFFVGVALFFGYLTNERVLYLANVPTLIGVLLGLFPTALLVGSKVGFGEVFSFGTIRVGKAMVSSSSRLALTAMAPLRLMCFVGLLIWCFVLRDYWHYWVEQDFASQLYLRDWYVYVTCFLAVYFLSALYLSYRSPRPLLLVGLCLLLNFPLVRLGIFLYTTRIEYFEEITKGYGISCFVLAFCFALAVAVRCGVSIANGEKLPGESLKRLITDPLF